MGLLRDTKFVLLQKGSPKSEVLIMKKHLIMFCASPMFEHFLPLYLLTTPNKGKEGAFFDL